MNNGTTQNGTNGKTKGTDLTNNINYLRTEPTDLLQNFGNGHSLQNTISDPVGFTTITSSPGLIYSKMSQVMKDIAHVSKNQTNTMQGFKFRGIDQFINALYPALTKHGVFMVPALQHETHELREVTRSNGKQGVDKHVHIQISYTFYAEDGSYVTAGPIPAESVDSGDKATNKALSAALKYALIQTFSIPTEDMAEGDLESPEIGIDVKTTTTAPKTATKRGFTAPTRQPTPGPTTTAFQKTTVTADPELLNKDVSNGTISKDGLTKVAEVVTSLPKSGSITLPADKTTGELTATTDGPAQQATAVAATTTATGTGDNLTVTPNAAPVVKKPRGHFNPPKRAPKTVKEE